MQCYHYLASAMVMANALESIPGAPKKLPPSVVADWMEDNHIDAEDLLLASDEDVRTTVENLVRSTRPGIRPAA